MSFESRGSSTGTGAPLYTIHPGEYEANMNYAFPPSHHQMPPPTYEDVISGKYLNWNNATHTWTSPITQQPPTQESAPPYQDNPKEKNYNTFWALFALLVCAVLIWRTCSK